MSKATLASSNKLSSNVRITTPISVDFISPTQATKPSQFFNKEQAWKNDLKKKYSSNLEQPGILQIENPLEKQITEFLNNFDEKIPFIVVSIIAILGIIISIAAFII